ncbi:MAG: hypothetical protein IID46_08730 [Planctomycetes bacterium]|nr:hypothetical protein [Planctomycetota bacterium]
MDEGQIDLREMSIKVQWGSFEGEIAEQSMNLRGGKSRYRYQLEKSGMEGIWTARFDLEKCDFRIKLTALELARHVPEVRIVIEGPTAVVFDETAVVVK